MLRREWLISLLVSVVVACGAPVWAQPAIPRYDPGPCPFETAEEHRTRVRCGTLVVPEDHGEPSGRVVRVAVAVLKAAEPAGLDPVVYLTGGPGEAAISSVESWLDKAFAKKRDLVLFDQRGTGRSEPLCPDATRELVRSVAADLSAAQDVEHTRDVARRCLESLRSRGVDPSAYHSAATARDLAALRPLLGYEQWHLLGVSYGTRLALTAMRDSPEGIRSVVLDSPFAPQEDFYRDVLPNFAPALARLAVDCANDASCRAGVADVKAELTALLSELAERPLTLSIDDSEFFPDGRFVVNAQDLQFLVDSQIQFGSTRHVMPGLLRAWREGKTESLAVLFKILAHAWNDIDLGKYYAVQCYEEMPFSAGPVAPAASRQAVAFHDATAAVCADWQLPPADPLENDPVKSAAPTLLLAGELDFRTSTANARRTAAHLENATVVEVPGAGHATMGHGCVDEVISAFLDHPDDAPDSTCLANRRVPPPLGALKVTGGPFRLVMGMRRGEPWGLLWLAAALLVLASAVLVWPPRALWRWRRRRRNSGRATAGQPAEAALRWRPRAVAHACLGLAALLAWIFTVGLARALAQLVDSDYAVAVLAGLPQSAAWLFWLPKLTTLLACAALAGAALGWRRAAWSRFDRVHFIVTLLGAVALIAFLGSYDLF